MREVTRQLEQVPRPGISMLALALLCLSPQTLAYFHSLLGLTKRMGVLLMCMSAHHVNT